MIIKPIKRPWIKEGISQGARYNPDPFYQSSEWKRVRRSHLMTQPNCVECGAPGYAVDHRQRIKDGGSRTDPSNLQTLCSRCHARKSANESNESRKK